MSKRCYRCDCREFKLSETDPQAILCTNCQTSFLKDDVLLQVTKECYEGNQKDIEKIIILTHEKVSLMKQGKDT